MPSTPGNWEQRWVDLVLIVLVLIVGNLGTQHSMGRGAFADSTGLAIARAGRFWAPPGPA